MKYYTIILIAIISLFTLTSCDNEIVIEKYSETLEQGIYAVADSLNSGRVDLAESYINNVETIVPVPKNRIIITPVIKDGIRYVIINDREKNSKVIIVGSSDFKELLNEKAINQKEEEIAANFQQQADKQKQIDTDALNQLVIENKKLTEEITQQNTIIEEYHNSLEYKVKSFLHWLSIGSLLGIPFVAIGLVVLCIFFPPAIPFVLQLVAYVISIVKIAVTNIRLIINNIITTLSQYITKKK
jgi:hypothetical protein